MLARRRSLSSLLLVSMVLAACGSSDGDGGGGGSSTGGTTPSAGGTSSGAAGGSAGGAAGSSVGGASGVSGTSGQGGAGASAGGASGATAGGAAGASAGGTSAGGASAGGTAAGGSNAGGTSAGQGAGGTKAAALVGAHIEPGDTTVTVTNGVAQPVTFQLIGEYDDGKTEPLTAAWTFDRIDLGTVTPGSGVLTPSGDKGGQGTLSAVSGGFTALASVHVKLVFTSTADGVTPEQQTALDGAGGDSDGSKILYPYDQTVFARGLVTPELMWSGGAAGDVYLVRVTEGDFEAKYYVKADPPARTTMPQLAWDALTVTNQGEDVQVSVRRLSNGVAYAPITQSWKVAQGSLRGSIYYWAVNKGQLLKIAPGATEPTPLFDPGQGSDLGTPAPANYNGATPPWESVAEGKRCVACHTVSRDGSTVATLFERLGSTASPWATLDLTQSPVAVTQVAPYDANAIFMALSPEGKFAVHNGVGMDMHLADAKTGKDIVSALDTFADKTADPSFSPDGKLLAFSSHVTGSYPVEFWRADLDVIDFDPTTMQFGARRTISSGGTQAIAFPSFTPDSAYVVYQKGDYSRAKYGANQHGFDKLFITSVTPGLGDIALDRANGVGMVEPRNLDINYQPTVNPIAVGGYYWVVFVSPRDYGNKMVSANDPSYENRKQLWVAAIDANPKPGVDPSHPAFLLRGQDESTINMNGYWSLEACKQQGNSCNEGFECCTGFCRDDGGGKPVCVAPPTNSCSGIGEKCIANGDCCSAELACIGGFCALGKP